MFWEDRIALPHDHLRWLGYGRVRLDMMSAEKLREMAGEAVSLPCWSAAMAAIFSTVNFEG